MKVKKNNPFFFVIQMILIILICHPLKIGSESFDPLSNKFYYFYKDTKLKLTLSKDEIAVKFKLDIDDEIKKNIISLMPDLEDISLATNLHNNLTLQKIKKGTEETGVINTLSSLNQRSEVTFATPVFVTYGALMILTNEFIVKFEDDLPQEKISLINNELGAIIVKKAQWQKNTYILKVDKSLHKNVLEMSNRYHQRPGIEYAHPNFIRIMKKLPLSHEGSIREENRPIPLIEEVAQKGNDTFETTWEPAAIQFSPTESFQAGAIEASGGADVLATTTTILTEGFEGPFPGSWSLYGSPTWCEETYKQYTGSYSAWCAGSSLNPNTQNYANNMNAWMVYGPFNLSDVDTACLRFYVWLKTQNNSDFFGWYVSTNGTDFYGYRISGDWAGQVGGQGWMCVTLYFNDLLGDLSDKNQVWIAFIFQSNSTINDKGAFVDAVTIEKFSGLESITTDIYSSWQWALKNIGQSGGQTDADIDIPEAWAISHDSPNIIVAIIDEGVDLTQPDLTSKIVPVSDRYDATDNDNDPSPNSWDAHGTCCSGIAAAVTGNAQGVAGVALEAKIMPIRIAYSPFAGADWYTTDTWIANGITFAADHGADILCNSWGGGTPTSIITNAVQHAVDSSCVVVFASGNNNYSMISYPATLSSSINGVIAVGAISQCDERKAYLTCDGEFWWGSNYGSELNVCAPGVRIYTSDIHGSGGYGAGDYISNFSGTSAATSYVAGLAALIVGVNTGLSPSEVRQLIQNNADDLGPPGWDAETGYGRINAYKAILAAQPLSVSVSPGNWDIGSKTEGSITSTWTPTTPAGSGYFYALNDGGKTENLTISVTGSVSWNPGSGPGDNVFAIGYGQTVAVGIEPGYTNITLGGVPLINNLGSGESYYFDLQFQAPISTNVGGIGQSVVVTITALPP